MFAWPVISKFLGDYWKYLAVAALMVAAIFWYNSQIDKAYQRGSDAGVAAQYKLDKAQMDKLQKDHDEAVLALEDKSKKLGDELDSIKSASAVKLAELNSKLVAKDKQLNKTTYDTRGAPIACLSPEEDIHLGFDFSTAWNEYNSSIAH